MKKEKVEIPESKIRVVIWMLKSGKTKKACCEFLNIAYNTKRLENIINDFQEKQLRAETIKERVKEQGLTANDIQDICKSYLEGETRMSLAARYFISDYKVVKILKENNIPIRGRGKNSAAKTDHVVQDLEIKFKAGDSVFVSSENSNGIVLAVYDEEFVDLLRTPIDRKIVYLHPYLEREAKNTLPEDESLLREDIHYNYYLHYDIKEFVAKKLITRPGLIPEQIKESAAKYMIRSYEKIIEETGRESYLVLITNKKHGYEYKVQIRRNDLFGFGG